MKNNNEEVIEILGAAKKLAQLVDDNYLDRVTTIILAG